MLRLVHLRIPCTLGGRNKRKRDSVLKYDASIQKKQMKKRVKILDDSASLRAVKHRRVGSRLYETVSTINVFDQDDEYSRSIVESLPQFRYTVFNNELVQETRPCADHRRRAAYKSCTPNVFCNMLGVVRPIGDSMRPFNYDTEVYVQVDHLEEILKEFRVNKKKCIMTNTFVTFVHKYSTEFAALEAGVARYSKLYTDLDMQTEMMYVTDFRNPQDVRNCECSNTRFRSVCLRDGLSNSTRFVNVKSLVQIHKRKGMGSLTIFEWLANFATSQLRAYVNEEMVHSRKLSANTDQLSFSVVPILKRTSSRCVEYQQPQQQQHQSLNKDRRRDAGAPSCTVTAATTNVVTDVELDQQQGCDGRSDDKGTHSRREVCAIEKNSSTIEQPPVYSVETVFAVLNDNNTESFNSTGLILGFNNANYLEVTSIDPECSGSSTKSCASAFFVATDESQQVPSQDSSIGSHQLARFDRFAQQQRQEHQLVRREARQQHQHPRHREILRRSEEKRSVQQSQSNESIDDEQSIAVENLIRSFHELEQIDLCERERGDEQHSGFIDRESAISFGRRTMGLDRLEARDDDNGINNNRGNSTENKRGNNIGGSNISFSFDLNKNDIVMTNETEMLLKDLLDSAEDSFSSIMDSSMSMTNCNETTAQSFDDIFDEKCLGLLEQFRWSMDEGDSETVTTVASTVTTGSTTLGNATTENENLTFCSSTSNVVNKNFLSNAVRTSPTRLLDMDTFVTTEFFSNGEIDESR